MTKRIKHFCFLFLFIFLLQFHTLDASAKEPIVIVLDPGHGGENLGATYNAHTEKDMTLIVANAMKEALEEYEGITVYLTRDIDQDMSIKSRADFAKEKNADFLFCLHFNMSIHHELYGSEVWVSAFGEDYVKGRQFGEIVLDEFQDMGLFSRGIKTRLNNKGENYYGILRYCSELEIPAVLIEHCHLDQKVDKPFYLDGDSNLKAFGQKDAEAVAKYFGLKSKDGTKDFSAYTKMNIEIPSIMEPDTTEPEVCEINLLSKDDSTHEATIQITANDPDSYIQYYCISQDDGASYGPLIPWSRSTWNQSDETIECTVSLLPHKDTILKVMVYNGYDLKKESHTIHIALPEIREESVADTEVLSNEVIVPSKEKKLDVTIVRDNETSLSKDTVLLVVLICCLSIVFVVILYILIRLILLLKQGNKRRRRRSK